MAKHNCVCGGGGANKMFIKIHFLKVHNYIKNLLFFLNKNLSIFKFNMRKNKY